MNRLTIFSQSCLVAMQLRLSALSLIPLFIATPYRHAPCMSLSRSLVVHLHCSFLLVHQCSSERLPDAPLGCRREFGCSLTGNLIPNRRMQRHGLMRMGHEVNVEGEGEGKGEDKYLYEDQDEGG